MLPEIKKDSLPRNGQRRTTKTTTAHIRGLLIATKKQQLDTGPLGSKMLEEWEG